MADGGSKSGAAAFSAKLVKTGLILDSTRPF
jgi:hypothetical protein